MPKTGNATSLLLLPCCVAAIAATAAQRLAWFVNSSPFPWNLTAPTSEPQHLTVEDVTDTTTTPVAAPREDRAGGIDGYLIEALRGGL